MTLGGEPPGVAVLYNSSDNLIKGEPCDMLAEQGVVVCANAISDALQAAGLRVALVPIHDKVEMALAPYAPTEWVVFNLGEGLEGRLFEEARIAWALEAMGYLFTGSKGDAIARSVDKAQTKRLLQANGVNTPAGWLFRHPDGVRRDLVDDLSFPLIVKPVAEDASIGVGPDAVVHTLAALRERVAYVVEQYRQAALAEMFIIGREFNIALWDEPVETLPLAEIDFSAFADPFERIVSFAAKWEESSFEYHHTPVRCPAPVSPRLAKDLIETARRVWDTVGCRGYARVDMRVAENGIPYVVEVNCNPDLSPDAGFYRAAQAAGHQYKDMALRIFDIAWREAYGYHREGSRNGWWGHSTNNGQHRHLYSVGNRVRAGAMERLPA
jgi:D-alanine-D-alanine ligase